MKNEYIVSIYTAGDELFPLSESPDCGEKFPAKNTDRFLSTSLWIRVGIPYIRRVDFVYIM
jgi:hypothetical protein